MPITSYLCHENFSHDPKVKFTEVILLGWRDGNQNGK